MMKVLYNEIEVFLVLGAKKYVLTELIFAKCEFLVYAKSHFLS